MIRPAVGAIWQTMFRARTGVAPRAVAAFVLLWALLSCGPIKRLLGRDHLPPPKVPPAPAPMALPAGEPPAQARALADALEDPKRRLSAWMQIYETLDVPIYGVTGSSLNKATADMPGPYFWTVWLMSGMEKKSMGVRFSDAGAVLTLGLRGADSKAVGQALLDDLRANAQSSKPSAKLLAELVRERVRRGASRADILDPKVGTEAVIDLPTLHLLSWLTFRGALARIATGIKIGALTPVPDRDRWAELSIIPEAHAAEGGFKCSELFGDKETTKWVKTLLKVVGGGGSIVFEDGAKASLPKANELLSKALGASGDLAKKISTVAGYANLVTSALSTYLAIHSLALRIDSTPAELERTKSMVDGKDQMHKIQIVTDYQGIPDGNNLQSCLTNFSNSIYGVSFKLPEDGKALSGVGVQFQEGSGFDRVLWGKFEQRKQKTDSKGYVDLKILGRAQKRELPSIAKAWKTEYSFVVEAQPEEEDLGSIANMFFGSLKAVTGTSKTGLAGPIFQLAKVAYWSLGEQTFSLVDWKPPGWTVSGAKGDVLVLRSGVRYREGLPDPDRRHDERSRHLSSRRPLPSFRWAVGLFRIVCGGHRIRRRHLQVHGRPVDVDEARPDRKRMRDPSVGNELRGWRGNLDSHRGDELFVAVKPGGSLTALAAE